MDIRWETLLELIPSGLPALCEQHWAECKVLRRRMSMDWERYAVLEMQGIIRWIGVREAGELVGYASICISRPLHHKHEDAAGMTDTIFLRKDRRRGIAGLRLIKAVMEMSREKGVEYFTMTERVTARGATAIGRVFERMGATMFERNWIVKLGEQNG